MRDDYNDVDVFDVGDVVDYKWCHMYRCWGLHTLKEDYNDVDVVDDGDDDDYQWCHMYRC